MTLVWQWGPATGPAPAGSSEEQAMRMVEQTAPVVYDADDTRVYCASCVQELIETGVAMESDAECLVPAPAGRVCDWCMVAPATLMEPA